LKKHFILSFFLIFAFLLYGCNERETTRVLQEPQENKKSETKLIAYLPAGMTSPFYSQVAQSAAPYGENYGLIMEAQAPPAETDFNGQIAIFEQFINKNVDGILFCAIDSKVMVPSILKANQANIPLIVFNSLTPYEGGEVDSYIGYNQYNAGYAVGEYAGTLLHDGGNIFIVRGVPGFHDTLRSQGFYKAIEKHPNIHIVGEKAGDWVRDKSIDIATRALEEYESIDLIIGLNDEMAIGAAIAAKKANKELFTIGIDCNPTSFMELEKGNLTATLAAFPDKMGEIAMEQMRKVLNGEEVASYIETPTVMVDIKNVDDFRAGKLWKEPLEAKPEIIKK
jgi:ribose transport system substrate-binding protein